ncbi:pentatricopeptide repeat-containing protein At1g28690, mitochondrial [Phalaenopsis equestris]|uniref:pentatricopeptide repeat-containing protein At1g28690, mitochondrial n=1 Tax=Phalaenopsis equestris TaxID=78828 RepID=UPI0009E22C5F|nr:pentatricopeptide repeat-containing protein At1g28690, mitochondrial [Phalaenopsis equestris]XP_020591499.1 pentatricopeptide repeat-containing protein At1g28690, mitochondrial [Phalaenopsis equestris]
MSLTPCFFFVRRQSSAYMAAALQSIIDSSSPSRGQPIHAYIIKYGLPPNTSVSIKLLILHLRCGSLNNARKVFDDMTKPTLSAFNYLISGYLRAGITGECLKLARKLAFSGEKLDGFTLSMVLRLSASIVSFNLAKQTHAQIIKSEFGYDDFLFAALIDSYVKNGMIRYARSTFLALPNRSLVCSTALIVGYMSQNSFRDAEELFRCLVNKDDVVYNAMIEGYSKIVETASKSFEVYKEMRFEDYKLTISTFVSVIGACSLLSAVEVGQQLHCQIIKSCIYCHVKAGSALIDMYSKCGAVEDARKIFDNMSEKNVFSWTSMIDGYGKNGISDKAIKLFNEMRTCSYVKPNHATFLSALSACGHAGLVSDGKEIFERMEKDHGLKPRMEHYACMVDLLGRADRLLEAHDFIKRIPEKPNSDVWGALLGASRVHGHVAMADIAAVELFKLCRSERPGAYIALSNTFAAAGRWDGVCRVRELMKERMVSKNAGYSWVDSEEVLHSFRSSQ